MAGGKYRSFLVHMKAVCDRSMEESARPVLRMPSSRPQGNKAHSLSNLLQRAQAPKVQYHLLTIVLHICLYERENEACMLVSAQLQNTGAVVCRKRPLLENRTVRLL